MHVGSLEVEVPKHSIGLPSPNQLYKERVNLPAEQRHSTSGMEGRGGDLTRLEPYFRHEVAGTPELGGEPVAGHLSGGVSMKKHYMERSVRRGVIFA
jgi:hypothetical protein